MRSRLLGEAEARMTGNSAKRGVGMAGDGNPGEVAARERPVCIEFEKNLQLE